LDAGSGTRVFTTTRWSLSSPERMPTAISKRLLRRWRSFAELYLATHFFLMSAAAAIRLGRAGPHAGFFPDDRKLTGCGRRIRAAVVSARYCSALQNFLHNVADKKQTLKRGGSVQFVSWMPGWQKRRRQLSMSDRRARRACARATF